MLQVHVSSGAQQGASCLSCTWTTIYHCCGAHEQLEAPEADVERCVKVKEYTTHDPEHGEDSEHLQRKRHMKHEGTWLYANPKHID